MNHNDRKVDWDEFMQFEKRFEAFALYSRDRINRLEEKYDKLPWLLLAVALNFLLSIVALLMQP